ncbi:MAG: cytochrome c biogenesis protein CcdA, partial [Aquificota bacterium]
MKVSILAAFGGGLLSFLSPCVLPLMPVYVSFVTGYSVQELKERE